MSARKCQSTMAMCGVLLSLWLFQFGCRPPEEPVQPPDSEALPAAEEPAPQTTAADPFAPAPVAPPATEEPAPQTTAADPFAPAPAALPATTASPAEPAVPSEPAKPAEPAAAAAQTPYEFQLPLGLPSPPPVPADNPMTVEKISLGKMLYFDNRVSKDGTISCATCHDPKMAWAEDTPTSKGIGGQMGGRNAPTVINSAYATSQFWDGRAKTLEEQAVGPVANPIEMGHSMEAVVHAFQQIPAYKDEFKKVFGTDVTEDGFAKAVAAFERTVLSGNSPYDKFNAGDKKALSEEARRGMELFDDVGCADCHAPPLFSSYQFMNAGVGTDKTPPDAGRMDVTKNDRDLGKFRVPALRDVAKTAPYFHDGSAKTLEDAVALMAGGGKDNPNLSSMMKSVREAKVTAEQQKDLVEFLKALSGEYPIVDAPEMPK